VAEYEIGETACLDGREGGTGVAGHPVIAMRGLCRARMHPDGIIPNRSGRAAKATSHLLVSVCK
jgi:hypothetical protein